MGPALISLLFTIGATTWLYTKLQRYSGNNTRSSIIAGAVAALVMFGVLYSILSLFIK